MNAGWRLREAAKGLRELTERTEQLMFGILSVVSVSSCSRLVPLDNC